METKKESPEEKYQCVFCGHARSECTCAFPPPASPERKTAEEGKTESWCKATYAHFDKEIQAKVKRIAELEAKAGKLVEALEKIEHDFSSLTPGKIATEALNEYRKP